MGRETHAAFTCENTMFFAFRNKLRIREWEKMGREAQRLHLPVKTQCFVHWGISCELGNRKTWDGRQTGGIYLWKANVGRETDRRHLLVKSQCFAQFGRRSAACTLMFPQQSLETIRERDVPDRRGLNISSICGTTGVCGKCFHIFWSPNLSAQNIVFSQVSATFVLPVPFFPIP